MLEKTNKTSPIALLPIIYYIGNFFKLYSSQIEISFLLLAFTGLFGLLVIWNNGLLRLDRMVVFYLIFMTMITAGVFIGGHNLSLIDLASSALLVGITGLMLMFPWNEKQGAVAFYIAFAFMLLRMIQHSETVLQVGSNNYVSILLIIMAALYYLPYEWNEKKLTIISLIPAFLTFFLSVLAAGRGGILTSGMMLAGIIGIYVLSHISNRQGRMIAVACMIVAAAAVVLIGMKMISRLGDFGSDGFNNAIRLTMWKQYIKGALSSPKYLMLGYPLGKIATIARFNNNPHNSFVLLHAIGGILPCILFFVYFIKAAVSYLKNKNYIALLMLLTIFVRGMTDKFIFGQYGMPVLVFLILFPYYRTKHSDYWERDSLVRCII